MKIEKGVMRIEKGVPIPRPRFNSLTDALSRMDIGDSVFIPGEKNTRPVNTHIWNTKKRRPGGFRFTSRTVDGGVRVWRIA
jgi:hypothetical protein